MTDWTPLRDYSSSRAVLIGTWDYENLPSIPAVGNSLKRMVRLLTSPLCGWPDDRILAISNERSPGDLPDRLITAFEDVTDVALFYYAGHGQIDMEDQLCLSLVASRTEANRRAATSLPFQAVRRALLDSPATTKILILDCCFAGLANRPANTLAALADDVLDKTAGAGAYTMAASGAFTTAWFETDPGIAQPQTLFTRYLADVVESGIPGEAPGLRLHPLFARVRDNLALDQCPVPCERSVDAARDFVFAYNAAPPETHRDPDSELRLLAQRLAEAEATRAQQQADAEAQERSLRAKAAELTKELERLKEQALHSQSMAAAQQGVLQDAIQHAERRLDETTAAQATVPGGAEAVPVSQMLEGTISFADVDRMMLAGGESRHVIDGALERVMTELNGLEPVQHGKAQIMFLRGRDELEIVYSTNPSDMRLRLAVGQSVSGRAIRERKTIIIGDVSRDMDYIRILGESIQSEIAIPILFGDDRVAIGVLNVESDEPQAFYGARQALLENFADKVSTLLAFTKMLTDVTETVEMRNADDLLIAVGDQTSHIIHRLNNTVGAMRLRILELQDMRNNGSLDGDTFLDESLEALRALAERILKMPDEASLLLGQDEANIDVNQCVRDAISLIYLPPNVQLQVELDEHIPELSLYHFDIVVKNLLQNGADAMPAGGLLSVSTSVISDPSLRTGYFQLIVRDSGQGIPIDIQRRVFELNFTTKREKGDGLGLWWVRNFVRRAGGDITLQSIPGSGTEVTVKIPVERVEEEERGHIEGVGSG